MGVLPPNRPRPSFALIARLVVALLALLALARGPSLAPPEVDRCRLHLTAMTPGEVPSTWSGWPVSLDLTEVLRQDALLEEEGHRRESWQYLGWSSIDRETCPEDARTFSHAARPAGAAPAVRVVSDQQHEATRYVAISAAPEHVVAAFRAEWRDDSYIKTEPGGSVRSSIANDARNLARFWIPGSLAFLLCLLPLALACRFANARRYVAGAVDADGELSIVGANGEMERVAPPYGWQAPGDTAPVLIRFSPRPRSRASAEPHLPYREISTAPEERRAQSVTMGTPAAIFHEAEQVPKWGLVVLTVICGLVWLLAQVGAMMADGPNC